jgi:cell division septal protein FtsQ
MYSPHKRGSYRQPRHFSKPNYSNPFFKPKKTQKSKRFYYGLLLLAASLFAWIYFLFSSTVFKITAWEITGLQVYNKSDIENALQSFMGNSKFFFFKFSNILAFNADDFKKYLSSGYAFKNINVSKYYPNKIIINLEEKRGKSAIYNKNNIYLVSDDGAVVLKKEGIGNCAELPQTNEAELTATTTISSYNIYMDKILSDARAKGLSNYPIFCDTYYAGDPAIGQTYPASSVLTIITDFMDGLREETNIRVKLAALVKNQVNPKIIIFTENNWKIYLNNADDGQKQFNKFYTVLQNEIKDVTKPLEYVDLRFGDRVYIK